MVCNLLENEINRWFDFITLNRDYITEWFSENDVFSILYFSLKTSEFKRFPELWPAFAWIFWARCLFEFKVFGEQISRDDQFNFFVPDFFEWFNL